MDFLSNKEKIKPQDFKRNRFSVLMVFGITVLAIGGMILCRDSSKIFKKITEPQTVVNTTVSPQLQPTPEFKKEIDEIEKMVKDLKGNYGIFVQDLASGKNYGINREKIFTAASLIKLPVFLSLFKEVEAGNLSLETKYILEEKDKRTGAGSIQYKPAGTVYTYRQMAELMGKQSDNTAFNVFVKILGKEKIQLVINYLGMKNTSFKDNQTTPGDIGLFFYKLYTQHILTRDSRDELLSFITDTIWEDRIPAGIPSGVRVAHKIGNEIGVISDAGIVFAQKPFILVIMSEEVLEKEAKEILPKIAGVVYKQLGN